MSQLLFCYSAAFPQAEADQRRATLLTLVDCNGAIDIRHIHISCVVLMNSFPAVPALLVSCALERLIKLQSPISRARTKKFWLHANHGSLLEAGEDGKGRRVYLDLGLILLPGIHQQHVLVPDIGVVPPPPPRQLTQRACC